MVITLCVNVVSLNNNAKNFKLPVIGHPEIVTRMITTTVVDKYPTATTIDHPHPIPLPTDPPDSLDHPISVTTTATVVTAIVLPPVTLMNPPTKSTSIATLKKLKLYAIREASALAKSPTSNSASTEIKVELINPSNDNNVLVLGLADTGAKSIFIKRSALNRIPHRIENCLIKSQGRYGNSSKISNIATFQLRLPQFSSSRVIKVRAYVEDNATGRHDIIFGIQFMSELGLVLDLKHQTLIWYDASMAMMPSGSIDISSLNEADPADTHLPAFVQEANTRLVKGMHPNNYKKHNYKDMVLQCSHLSPMMKQQALTLFANYKVLFDGGLGLIPGPPVSLKIKPNVRPYCARAYTIPQAFTQMAHNEIKDLEGIDVRTSNVDSPWGFPCFFRKKKDGGIRFITDLRRLNASIERCPFPLPLIEDVLWKIQGFTFSACLDLNRGYYHFPLDQEAQKLCTIVLPWGKRSYTRMPMGLMVASDIFQQRMQSIFHPLLDSIIIYIDNILLFTKDSFEHHLRKLEQVFIILQANNLHVHIEQTFLASTTVNYLGYTLTSKGIKPQKEKILPILRLAPPQNVKQLRRFLGFVNHYKKMWHQRSEICRPLTQLTSSKVKWKWEEIHMQAFDKMKNVMAREVLLNYPNFEKPFHVFADASKYQLGGVIVQDDNPV